MFTTSDSSLSNSVGVEKCGENFAPLELLPNASAAINIRLLRSYYRIPSVSVRSKPRLAVPKSLKTKADSAFKPSDAVNSYAAIVPFTFIAYAFNFGLPHDQLADRADAGGRRYLP